MILKFWIADKLKELQNELEKNKDSQFPVKDRINAQIEILKEVKNHAL